MIIFTPILIASIPLKQNATPGEHKHSVCVCVCMFLPACLYYSAPMVSNTLPTHKLTHYTKGK